MHVRCFLDLPFSPFSHFFDVSIVVPSSSRLSTIRFRETVGMAMWAVGSLSTLSGCLVRWLAGSRMYRYQGTICPHVKTKKSPLLRFSAPRPLRDPPFAPCPVFFWTWTARTGLCCPLGGPFVLLFSPQCQRVDGQTANGPIINPPPLHKKHGDNHGDKWRQLWRLSASTASSGTHQNCWG